MALITNINNVIYDFHVVLTIFCYKYKESIWASDIYFFINRSTPGGTVKENAYNRFREGA